MVPGGAAEEREPWQEDWGGTGGEGRGGLRVRARQRLDRQGGRRPDAHGSLTSSLGARAAPDFMARNTDYVPCVGFDEVLKIFLRIMGQNEDTFRNRYGRVIFNVIREYRFIEIVDNRLVYGQFFFIVVKHT